MTIASGLTAPVQAELLIDSPVTQTPKPDYDQKVTVTNTGSITVSGTALDLNNQYRSYWWNIENSGQITSTQGRAIDLGIPGSNNTWYGSYTLRNNPDGQIQGAEDAIRISNQPSGAPLSIFRTPELSLR